MRADRRQRRPRPPPPQLGSVRRSLKAPIATNAANVTGFVNMLIAARDAKVKRFVCAASSSAYGDDPRLPKVEDVIGRPLSPYAVTKFVNELYAGVFACCYGVETIGLRSFNVFGARQDPHGAYAAVIPKWTAAMIKDGAVFIVAKARLAARRTESCCLIASDVFAVLKVCLTRNRILNGLCLSLSR